MVHDAVSRPIVADAMQGINGTVFVYGQTSSGKTHTMMGTDDHPGIIPQAIDDIFESIEAQNDREFLLRVSFLEIYNENISDLFNGSNTNLKIHETVEGDIFIGDLTEEVVYTPEDVLSLLERGLRNRKVGATRMNDHSSRSHTIFRFVIESREYVPETSENAGRESLQGAVRVSHLNLVDLAGSERIANTGAEGMRLKEGASINKSLHCLGNVISKLTESTDAAHVPYRDSKLTRILQNSLGGNARTGIICTVTAAAVHQDETISTLKFATRAKKICNHAVVNEVYDEKAQIVKLRKQIRELEKEKLELESGAAVQQLEAEKAQLARDLAAQKENISKLSTMLLHSDALIQPSPRVQNPRARRNERRKTWAAPKHRRSMMRSRMSILPGSGSGIGGRRSILPSADVLLNSSEPMETAVEGPVDTSRRRRQARPAASATDSGTFSRQEVLEGKNRQLERQVRELEDALNSVNELLEGTIRDKDRVTEQLEQAMAQAAAAPAQEVGPSPSEIEELHQKLKAAAEHAEELVCAKKQCEEYLQHQLQEQRDLNNMLKDELEAFQSITPPASPSGAVRAAVGPLESTIEELRAQLAVHEDTIKNLQGEQATREASHNQAMEELRESARAEAEAQLREELEDMAKQVGAANDAKQAAEDNAYMLEHQLNTTRSKLEAATQELQQARGEDQSTESKTETDAATSVLQQRVDELEAEREEFLATLQPFGLGAPADLLAYLNGIKTSVEAMQAETLAQSTAATEAEAKVAELTNQLDALNATAAHAFELEGQLQKAQQEAATSNQARAAAEEACATATANAEHLQRQLAALQAARDTLESSMSALATQMAENGAQDAALAELHAQMAQVQQERVLAEQARDQFEHDCQKWQAKANELKKTLADRDWEADEGSWHTTRRMEELQAEADDNEARCEALLEDFQVLESQNEELVLATQELELRVHMLESQSTTSTAALQVDVTQSETTHVATSSLQALLAHAEQHIAELEAERDGLAHAVEELHGGDEDAIEVACAFAEAAFDYSVRQSLAETRAQLEVAETRLAVVMAQESAQPEASDVLTPRREALQAECTMLRQQVAELRDAKEQASPQQTAATPPTAPSTAARARKGLLSKLTKSVSRSVSKAVKRKRLGRKTAIDSPMVGGAVSAFDMEAAAVANESPMPMEEDGPAVSPEMAAALHDLAELREAHTSLETNFVAASEMAERLQAQLTAAKLEAAEIQEAFAIAQQQREAMAAELEALQSEPASEPTVDEATMAALKSERDALQTQLEDMVTQDSYDEQVERVLELDGRLTRSQACVTEMEQQLEALCHERDLFQAKCVVFEQKEESMRQELEHLREARLSAEPVVDEDLTAKFQALESKHTSLTAELASVTARLSAEVESKQTDLDDLRVRVAEMTTQLSAAQQAHDSVMQELTEARAQLTAAADQEALAAEHEAQVAALRAQLATLQAAQASAENDLAASAAQRDEAEARASELHAQLAQTQQEKETVCTELAKTRDELSQAEQSHKHETAGVSASLEEAEQARAAAEHELSVQREQADLARAEVASLHEKLAELQTAERDAATSRTELEEALQKLATTQSKLSEVEQALAAADSAQASLEAEHATQVREHQEQVEELQDTVEGLRLHCTELEAQIAAIDSTNTANEEVTTLTLQLEHAQRARDEAVAETENLKAQLAEAEEKLVAVQQKSLDTRAELQRVELRLTKMKSKHDRLHQTIVAGDNYLEMRIASLTEELEARTGELQALREGLEREGARDAEMDDLRAQISRLQEEREDVAAAAARARQATQEIEALQEELTQARACLSGIDSTENTLKAALLDVREENHRLRSLVDKLRVVEPTSSDASQAGSTTAVGGPDHEVSLVDPNASLVARARAVRSAASDAGSGTAGVGARVVRAMSALEPDVGETTLENVAPEAAATPTNAAPSLEPSGSGSGKRGAALSSSATSSPSRPAAKRPLSERIQNTPSKDLFGRSKQKAEMIRQASGKEDTQQVRFQLPSGEQVTTGDEVVAPRDPVAAGSQLARKSRQAEVRSDIDRDEHPAECAPQ
ncbi:uncharacterized protein MONBRDRAFT_34081 [Monosiga brevicollis MX1]|uniref:Kinesin motor domain-containing protein n=1 Tax=Monosiga brevicollis TaxID=81824 RepID=A9V9C8_MONBE|nr:uncharacterized protein MONBRDRAFT_34081 [Monosiga brevicollis MX1]EDQ85907.1 predicted protein [Monosiga brevicollis MX1]|eukprot:XP_001749386.1 hypothetical protein [Monosiga brevicollis MX1]